MSTIVTRAGKGSPLTHVEVDANFTNLNTDKVEKTSAAITGGTINGTTIGATTPSTGNFTTLTAQTEVLRGTGQNLVVRSQAFSFWCSSGSSNVTGTDNVTTAPDGTSTASSVVPNTTNGLHRMYTPVTSGTASASSGATYTFSFYAKANGYRYVFLNMGSLTGTAVFDVQAGTVTNGTATSASINSVGNSWYRCVVTGTASASGVPAFYIQINNTFALGDQSFAGDGTSSIFFWGAQWEFGSTANTYIPTTTTAVYGTPTLSFSGVSTLGLESNGALFLQPAGTGAIQAQATTSTSAGGNARGANAVDWQTSRAAASQVASGSNSSVLGGINNSVTNSFSTLCGGSTNLASGAVSSIVGGSANTVSGERSFIGGGTSNTAGGYFNVITGGFTNSGTANAAVTTQAAATNGVTSGSTAVTLAASNASIRVGQFITGTGIVLHTYVAAISGTSLTLSQNANATGTPTLSFFTPHGVVVGGGNNQATGAYSFIGGGGDAGTSANRNVASGDWSFVGGGVKNVASGNGATVGGGGYDGTSINGNTASGGASFVGGGQANIASATGSSILGGLGNTANSVYSSIIGSRSGTTRSIIGNTIIPASNIPIASGVGVQQSAILILGTATTDATPTVLRSDTNAAGTTNQVILPNNSAYYFRGEIVAGVTGGGNTKGWFVEGVIKRGANAASTAIVGTATVTSNYADAGASTWAVTATADTTNGGLKIEVTGQASTTIRWVAQIRTTEMTF